MSALIHVIGDSHAQYLVLKKRSTADRLRLPEDLPFSLRTAVVPGALLSGLQMKDAEVPLRVQIETTIREAGCLCLAIGQTDLEFDFYQRQVMRGENWTPDAYVDFLIEIYWSLLEDLPIGDCDLVLKGVNLTVLSTRDFSAAYVGRAITGDDARAEQARLALMDHMLDERRQNDMHLLFNRRLADLCAGLGHGYFDLNDYLAARDRLGRLREPRVLDDAFQPLKRDHHVVQTVGVCREHYDSIGRAFGLIADAPLVLSRKMAVTG